MCQGSYFACLTNIDRRSEGRAGHDHHPRSLPNTMMMMKMVFTCNPNHSGCQRLEYRSLPLTLLQLFIIFTHTGFCTGFHLFRILYICCSILLSTLHSGISSHRIFCSTAMEGQSFAILALQGILASTPSSLHPSRSNSFGLRSTYIKDQLDHSTSRAPLSTWRQS